MKLEAAVQLFVLQYDKESTRRAYQDSLRLLVEMLGEKRLVTEITSAELMGLVPLLRERGYADATRYKHLKATKTLFNWLVNIGTLERNPAKPLKAIKPQHLIPREKAMTQRELEKVLDYAKWKPRDYALILFLADTGCRAGGAASLKVSDLDLDRGRATVTEKGDKTRPVFFGQECTRALRVWLSKRDTYVGYVFDRHGRKLTAAAISQILRRNCLKVGIRSLGSHSLRHRKGHQLADARVAPSVAANALGHTDPVITLHHYYPHDWDRVENEMRQLTVPENPSEKGP